ncbi:MAG: hypothetical protein HAW66_06740 [Shewanella sp.]|nr:hypothetical protein [Shewanella sp.]
MSSSNSINTVPSLTWNSGLKKLDVLTEEQIQHLVEQGANHKLGAYNNIKVKFNVQMGEKFHHNVEFKVSYSQQNGIKTSLANYFAKSELKEIGTQLRVAYNGSEFWKQNNECTIEFDNVNERTDKTVGYLGVYQPFDIIENSQPQSDTPCVGSGNTQEPEEQSLQLDSASASVNGDGSVTDNEQCLLTGEDGFIFEWLTEQDKKEIAEQEQSRKEEALVDELSAEELQELLASKCVKSTSKSVPTDKKRSDSNTSVQDHQLVSTVTEDVYKKIIERYDKDAEEINSEITQSLTSDSHAGGASEVADAITSANIPVLPAAATVVGSKEENLLPNNDKTDSESLASDDTSGSSASMISDEPYKTDEDKNIDTEKSKKRKKNKIRDQDESGKRKRRVEEQDKLTLDTTLEEDFHKLTPPHTTFENETSQGEKEGAKVETPPVPTTSTHSTTSAVQQSSPIRNVTNLIDISPKLHLRDNNLLFVFCDTAWSKPQIEKKNYFGTKKSVANCSEIITSWKADAVKKSNNLKIICIDKSPIVAESFFENLSINRDNFDSVMPPFLGDVQISLSQAVYDISIKKLVNDKDLAVRVICDSQTMLEELEQFLSGYDFKGYRVTGKL